MFWFLLGWWFGSAEHDEPERPRYFKEIPPRKLTKEKIKGWISRFIIENNSCNLYNYLLY